MLAPFEVGLAFIERLKLFDLDIKQVLVSVNTDADESEIKPGERSANQPPALPWPADAGAAASTVFVTWPSGVP